MQHVPNALTLLRLLIAPLIGALLLLVALGGWAPALWLPVALGLFMLACLTDLADGVLARRLSVESTSGAVLDPVAAEAGEGAAALLAAFANGSKDWFIVSRRHKGGSLLDGAQDS